MSFKDDAKNEILLSLPESYEEIKAFLSAVSRMNGSLEISSRRMNLALRLDSYEEGMKIADLFKRLYPTDIELDIVKNQKTAKNSCVLKIPAGFTKQALTDLELMRGDDGELSGFIEEIPQQLIADNLCRIAYLKGLFLACGSVYAPGLSDGKTTGYHFEFSFEDEIFADGVMEIMSDLRLNSKMSDRAEHKLVYVKDKEEILNILAILGLNDCALKFKEIMDERATANCLNRSVICETANLDKTYEASTKHMLAIAKLKNHGEFDKMPYHLIETAECRTKYPEASMSELADILGVSKSCLNHRLRKLVELADACDRQNDDMY